MCQITLQQRQEQIGYYANQYPRYVRYATVLKRVLQRACTVDFPEALVQSRPKSISSFAKKCLRKFDDYPDAVFQMPDLCGGRIIVQTLGQVRAVQQFIEANFEILERDDKRLSLSDGKLGYRDMYYVIRLRSERCSPLGITPAEVEEIGTRCAEIQVRTWLQHAWASIHERIYKIPVQLPLGVQRTSVLLAAVLEESDRSYEQMGVDLDRMLSDYAAFATQAELDDEIVVQSLILENERDDVKKPALAVQLGRVLGANGQYGRVVETLQTYQDIQSANRCELLQDLGYALCQQHRKSPLSGEYQFGVSLLERTRDGFIQQNEAAVVVPLHKQANLHARVLWRLGWALEPLPGREREARESLRQAHEHEPDNPFYLAEMLGAEMYYAKRQIAPDAMRTTILRAVATCRASAESGIGQFSACLTAGRLSHLLDNSHDAFAYYAMGIRSFLEARRYVPADELQRERDWLRRLGLGKIPSTACQWIAELLTMGESLASQEHVSNESADSKPLVLVVVGGAVSMDSNQLGRIRPLMEAALDAFIGQVISGGTAVGVPGCVGEVTAALADRGGKKFDLLGYLPEELPPDTPLDHRYDRLVACGGTGFSLGQSLRSWSDLLAVGVHPAEITVLGFGGGLISAAEYRLALALGANVVVVVGTGGAVDELLTDRLWCHLPNLFPVPPDAASLRAIVSPATRTFDGDVLNRMAVAFHQNYLVNNTGRLPDNMKPWPILPETFQQASLDQASYSVQILEAVGYGVREAEAPEVFRFSAKDERLLEKMAELEHGRWNVERLRNGWRWGPRDDRRKLHDCLISWSDLSEDIKKFARDTVRKFPEILAEARLEVYRK